MANWKARTSSDAAGASGCEYDVFLNFRGEETRHNFTDFLYDRLVNAGIHTFRDEEELPHGDVISDRLERAINNSTLDIPIFSPNYASSKWCLRELKLIIDNVSNSGDQERILPIFLFVKVDDVKFKNRPDGDTIYKPAFKDHEKNFTGEVKAWKTALTKASKHKGWVVDENTSQVAIVESVVKEVLEKLKIKQRLVTEHLVGLDNRIKDLTKLLDVNHNDVRLIGIYEMGGVGKTTIAMVVFNQLCSHFGKCCSFLEGVRERSTKEGIVPLQEKLLSDISGSASVEKFEDSEEGMQRIGRTLSNKRVLVVLDDVDKKVPIKNLIGNSKLCRGSRIIITTRNKDNLQIEGSEVKIEQYEMKTMDDGLALQLFCWHAFCKDRPSDDYRELSREIVSLMGGLPLAIKVIGSLLKDREDKEIWKEMLDSLTEALEKDILEKLRISYDDLGTNQKQIFLDIACFFFNEELTDAIYMWQSCKLNPITGIEDLTKRCLIKILDNDKIWMHDLLIALGRQIVREDSQHILTKQSRLWISEEALRIIRIKKMKGKVQALEISGDVTPIEISNEQFESLPNLRFLDLKWGTYAGDFAKCHSNLRWFSWSWPPFTEDFKMINFDLDFRADNFYLDRLVVCKFFRMDFKDDPKAWDLIKRAQELKVLSITSCYGITTIPDISKCSALERLTIESCSSLKRIEGFIGCLRWLIDLKIEECHNITDLPKEVGELVNLKCLSLFNCRKLRELPSSFEKLTSLTELNLSGTKIRELPNSIVQLKLLRILHFRIYPSYGEDNHDWQLPSGIGTFVNLEELDLFGHISMKGEIPDEIGECSSLRILELQGTYICRIPSTINKHNHLQTLNLTDCHEIQELPELPTSLTYLFLRSKSLLSVPNLSKLTSLVKLLLSDYSAHNGKSNLIPGCHLKWIGKLSRLKWLELCLLNVSAPPNLASLSHLEQLVLKRLDLKPLVQIPSSDWSWRDLSTLEIHCCEELRRLSIPSEIRKLRRVELSWCSKLVEIQVVGPSKSLECLEIFGCESLTRISGLPYLKKLETLTIQSCNMLAHVGGLNELDTLKFLIVYHCGLLRRLIDASYTKIKDNCDVHIMCCGYFIKDFEGIMKHYRDEILRNTSNKISFTIRFHLGVKKLSSQGWLEFVGGIEREKEGVDPDSVTYEGLIADVKNFGFRMKRMWYKDPRNRQMEIKHDGDVSEMLEWASRRGFLIHLFVEGGVDSEWEGEYDDEMMEMLREDYARKTDVSSDGDGAMGTVSCPNEGSNSAPVRESETHGTSSVDYSELAPGNAKCFEATTSIAGNDLDSVDKQGKRQRDEDHASQTYTTTKNSTCGQQNGIPQHVTRMTRSQAAKIQPPVEVAALPAEAVGPSRKKKKNDSKRVNPIRRSARLMKGPTGGTSDTVHLD